MEESMGERPIDRLLAIMARLRDPERGCSWDLEQSFATIAPYTIEEAYEVAEAIQLGDMAGLREELGDLLLQVVFHGQMAQEAGLFGFDDIATAISAKMIDRHPHVFGDAPRTGPEDQILSWEALKAAERAKKAAIPISALDGVAVALPALTRAEKIQKRAARVGFDWPGEGKLAANPVFEKIAEEVDEILSALDEGADQEKIEEEVGDLLFAVVNLGRKLSVDPETALRRATHKFITRFQTIEGKLRGRGLAVSDQTLDQLEILWQEAKAEEQ